MFFAKIPRHTRQNAITEGDLECILTRNCEGTEQLRIKMTKEPAARNISCGRLLKYYCLYRKIYFRINTTARTYISKLIFFSFAFPVTTFMIT